MSENPFEVLRLDPATRIEDAVKHADRLIQETADEPRKARLRQAAQQLSVSSDRAALAALLSPPAPGYESATLNQFAKKYGTPPQGTQVVGPPRLDEEEFKRRLLEAMAGELEPGPAELEALPVAESGSEIAKQTAEAMWQALLTDMRG